MKKLSEMYRPIDKWLSTHKTLMAIIIAIELAALWFALSVLPNLKHR